MVDVDTTEVRKLLEWMRAWNAGHAREGKFCDISM
jgi:erythromycin esterase-like protein